jgi:hypothetical protein
MHYGAISHRPTVGPSQMRCIMRIMHCERMHYEKVYCTTFSSPFSEKGNRKLPTIILSIPLMNHLG